ncbi:ATP-binding protein [Ahrensia marina]|uniref:histidine kinase n=1 Tax=Ahrensia marina TaxID=1514904 RepID=A0A0N0VLS7_9HYPH|nr:ATP-binding protein [Ahrensia marina]KPB01894.1 hypothetical protein SU32_05890 [Ahrensia marina]
MDDLRAISDDKKELEAQADQLWESVEMNALGDAVVDCTTEGKIIHANAVFANLVDQPAETIIGQDREQFAFLKGGKSPRCFKKLTAQDGTETWFDRLQFSMREPDTGDIFIRVIGRDITQHKRTEAALIEARRQAEEADAAKSRFLAMVSHEIRTPLNGITGMGRLLADTQLTAEQRNYTESMISSSEALLLLVNDLLQFGREEISANKINAEPTTIASLIAGVVELLAEKAHHKNIDLGYDLSAEVPEKINIDAGRLRQILFNIIGNAIKFTDKGGVRIDVSYCGNHLTVRVQDTGPGIAEEHQTNIFMPFEQVENTFNRTHDGAGLGLSIARKMAIAMGGDISLDSAVGEGSIFNVNVRATPITEAKKNVTINETVLVCMKQGFEADLLSGLASRAGAHVLQCASISEMHQLAYQWPYPSKIIIDQRLTKTPPLEQIEFALPDCQAIALITPEQRGTIGAAFKAANHGFLTRPVRPSTALRVLGNDIPSIEKSEDRQPATIQKENNKKYNVLVAEDNPINALLATNMLERASCRVTHVTDGAQAVEKLNKQHEYDIVLMDLHMPVMDGLTAIKAIRRNEEERNAPSVALLAVTADNQLSTNEAIMAAGASGILEKPFNIDALIIMLEEKTTSVA